MSQIGESIRMGQVGKIIDQTKCFFHEDHDCKDNPKNDLQRDKNFGENIEQGDSTVLRTDDKGAQYKVPQKEINPDQLPNMKVKIGSKNYDVGFQPHHLIPVSVIKKHEIRLMLKKGTKFNLCCNVGYGVNGSENGLWLPAMHKVSCWSSWDPKEQIKYMIAASRLLNPPRQFHTSHPDYISDVSGRLSKYNADILKMKMCKKCQETNDKHKPPLRLLGVLNALSFKMRTKYLIGNVTHKLVYTHKFSSEILSELKKP